MVGWDSNFLDGLFCLDDQVFKVLYLDVHSLKTLMRDYRLFWVLDFIYETASDLLNEYSAMLTWRETALCKTIVAKNFIKRLKCASNDVERLRSATAKMLYEVFKICRKLTIEDKIIVAENFNLNRIGK